MCYIQGGHNQDEIKSHMNWVGTHKLENIPQKFSPKSECSEPHKGLPSLEVWRQEEVAPETPALKASGV